MPDADANMVATVWHTVRIPALLASFERLLKGCCLRGLMLFVVRVQPLSRRGGPTQGLMRSTQSSYQLVLAQTFASCCSLCDLLLTWRCSSSVSSTPWPGCCPLGTFRSWIAGMAAAKTWFATCRSQGHGAIGGLSQTGSAADSKHHVL